MISEMQIKLSGLQGRALELMRERGWQIITAPMEFKQSMKGSVITIDATWSAGFRKLGEPASQEQWNAELKEIWDELCQTTGE